jgi:hypothetical protein
MKEKTIYGFTDDSLTIDKEWKNFKKIEKNISNLEIHTRFQLF